MTLSRAAARASNYATYRYDATDYSAATLATVATRVTETRTSYSNTVLYNKVLEYPTGATAEVVETCYAGEQPDPYRPGWSADNGVTISEAVIQSGIDHYNASPDGTKLLLDVETWEPRGTTLDAAIENCQTICRMWKEQTTREIGFYAIAPWPVWKYPEGYGAAYVADPQTYSSMDRYEGTLACEMHFDDEMYAAIQPYIDFLVPSCYARYLDQMATWKWQAAWQIESALRLANGQKEVYPIYYPWALVDAEHDSEANFVIGMQFVASYPGIAGTFAWRDQTGTPAYWAGQIAHLIAGTGSFTDS